MSIGIPRSHGPCPWCWPPVQDCGRDEVPHETWFLGIEFNETDPDNY